MRIFHLARLQFKLFEWKWKLNGFKASLTHTPRRNILDFGRLNPFASSIHGELRRNHEVLTTLTYK